MCRKIVRCNSFESISISSIWEKCEVSAIAVSTCAFLNFFLLFLVSFLLFAWLLLPFSLLCGSVLFRFGSSCRIFFLTGSTGRSMLQVTDTTLSDLELCLLFGVMEINSKLTHLEVLDVELTAETVKPLAQLLASKNNIKDLL